MAVLIDANSPEVKERAKWEQFPTAETMAARIQPGNPYVFRPYPKMLVRARRIPPGFENAGKWACSLQAPAYHGFRNTDEWNRACELAALWTVGNQRTVSDQDEERRARDNGEGWGDNTKEALAIASQLEKMVSDAAGERHYRDSKMSEKAQAEALQHDRATFEHQAEVPEKPIKRRPGRPRKSAA